MAVGGWAWLEARRSRRVLRVPLVVGGQRQRRWSGGWPRQGREAGESVRQFMSPWPAGGDPQVEAAASTWDGSTWKWADHGTATGRVLERPGEVLTVQDSMAL